jgi:hypothetical protein
LECEQQQHPEKRMNHKSAEVSPPTAERIREGEHHKKSYSASRDHWGGLIPTRLAAQNFYCRPQRGEGQDQAGCQGEITVEPGIDAQHVEDPKQVNASRYRRAKVDAAFDAG